MLYEINEKWFEHENGYSAVLYGESSMQVFLNNKFVMHTGFRCVNTESEVMEILEGMPEFFQMLRREEK